MFLVLLILFTCSFVVHMLIRDILLLDLCGEWSVQVQLWDEGIGHEDEHPLFEWSFAYRGKCDDDSDDDWDQAEKNTEQVAQKGALQRTQ